MSAPSQSNAIAHHGPSLGTTFGVFGTLMVLTCVTVAVAYQDLGRWSAVAALGIASVKAVLVVLYFMHVRYASRLIGLYAAGGLVFLAILLGVTMSEVAGRPAPPRVDPLRPSAPAALPAHRAADEEPP